MPSFLNQGEDTLASPILKLARRLVRDALHTLALDSLTPQDVLRGGKDMVTQSYWLNPNPYSVLSGSRMSPSPQLVGMQQCKTLTPIRRSGGPVFGTTDEEDDE
jgi:hypothetical protein